MHFQPRAIVAALVTAGTLVVPAAGVSAAPRHTTHTLKLPRDYVAWSKVARCEEGGVIPGVTWYNPNTTSYPDALGIQAAAYYQFGGKSQPWGPVSLANRIAEIKVADRLIAYYHASIPDQYGCAAW